MTANLVQQLRDVSNADPLYGLWWRAADEIERLERESRERLETVCATNDRLVAALDDRDSYKEQMVRAQIDLHAIKRKADEIERLYALVDDSVDKARAWDAVTKDSAKSVRSAFLIYLQVENECGRTGKPCCDKCACALEMDGYIYDVRAALPPGERP